MKIIVLKFGGTSVGSIQRIKKVSKIIKSYSKKYRVIVLSSAMSGTTNKLINMSKKISENFPDNEYDTLVSAGEQISCSLLAGHLAANGLNSRSWMAWQIPIITEGKHKYSRIKYINKTKILKFLKPDYLFKGSDYRNKKIVGKKYVKSYGGHVKVLKNLKNISTTKIILKSKQSR